MSLLVIVVIILVFILLIAIVGLVAKTVVVVPQEPYVNPTCARSLDQLTDITTAPCCCRQGDQTNKKYLAELDVVVAPNPTYFLTACAGFCPGGAVNVITQKCQTSGQYPRFDACVKATKPVGCQGSALPVARVGITAYYANSATRQGLCEQDGACYPSASTCPVNP